MSIRFNRAYLAKIANAVAALTTLYERVPARYMRQELGAYSRAADFLRKIEKYVYVNIGRTPPQGSTADIQHNQITLGEINEQRTTARRLFRLSKENGGASLEKRHSKIQSLLKDFAAHIDECIKRGF